MTRFSGQKIARLSATRHADIDFKRLWPYHYSNEKVCFHLASLVARRMRRERTLATTRIASWDARVKGIDDAAVRNLSITSISVQRWLDRLNPRFRQIAMARLSEMEVNLETAAGG